MLHNYPATTIVLLHILAILALPTLDHEREFSPSLEADASIDFSSYPEFTSLKPCLRSFFGGPGGGGSDNQVATNVQCVANSCLCTPENIKENLPHISTQVEESCAKATNVKERIGQATSVLSRYCSMVTAGVTTTTLGSDSSKTTSTTKPKPKPTSEEDEITNEELYPLSDDSVPKDRPAKEAIIGGLTKGHLIGIGVASFVGICGIAIGIRNLCYQRNAQHHREGRL